MNVCSFSVWHTLTGQNFHALPFGDLHVNFILVFCTIFIEFSLMRLSFLLFAKWEERWGSIRFQCTVYWYRHRLRAPPFVYFSQLTEQCSSLPACTHPTIQFCTGFHAQIVQLYTKFNDSEQKKSDNNSTLSSYFHLKTVKMHRPHVFNGGWLFCI